MATRRVFRTRVRCPQMRTDLSTSASQNAMVGGSVLLERSAGASVRLVIDGNPVGALDADVAEKVAPVLERGQLLKAVIEKAFPIYDDKFKAAGGQLDIKVEYLLEKGQPAIMTKRVWRCVEPSHGSPESHGAVASFFTKVAGVTFEGRQRIVARCSEGERLMLVRDPMDRFDKGAMKVMRSNGEQLGFIPAHVSRGGEPSGLAAEMDRGREYHAKISQITGGGPGENLGVNIEVIAGADSEGTRLAELQPALSAKRAPSQWALAIVLLGCLALAGALLLYFGK